jgi:hypothetical protein
MIDLVTANEFTFTPSAFIAAYVEKSKDELTTTESTTNGGTLTTLAGDGASSSGLNTTLANKLIDEASDVAQATTIDPSVINYVPGFVGQGTSQPLVVSSGGAGSAQGSPLTVSGAVVDFLGQRVTDTRTVYKTTIQSHQFYIVLVLSYGTFRSPADDKASAQATVAAIYVQVAAYLNSLV